jgi:hypothetical protein
MLVDETVDFLLQLWQQAGMLMNQERLVGRKAVHPVL